MSIMKEFREFAIKGNMVDMAVGIIIGTAFGRIISSLVNDVIMPPLGMLIGGVDFTELKILLKTATVDQAGNAIDAVTMNYGMFVQNLVDFLIVAFTIFLVVKAINKLKKKQETAPPPAAPAPTKEEVLLTEIRDLLKK